MLVVSSFVGYLDITGDTTGARQDGWIAKRNTGAPVPRMENIRLLEENFAPPADLCNFTEEDLYETFSERERSGQIFPQSRPKG